MDEFESADWEGICAYTVLYMVDNLAEDYEPGDENVW